jgi:zinc/manganese transport system ATP-binding protein/zinc transport system ATP-binding protein
LKILIRNKFSLPYQSLLVGHLLFRTLVQRVCKSKRYGCGIAIIGGLSRLLQLKAKVLIITNKTEGQKNLAKIVELHHLHCAYQSNVVLQDINLSLEEGEFVGLVGPSGSGKTTLLKTLLGAIVPISGAVRVAGQPVKNGRPPRDIGYVPQLETIDWAFPVTVEQVVLMGRIREQSLVPWASREDKKAVREMLERLGLSGLANRHIRNLSGGQQQRVFLARALISHPKLLLLDEPTSGVDIKTRNEVLLLLAQINQSGVTVILTTHDLNSVAAHLPKVVCLNRQLIASGNPYEVFNEEVLETTYGSKMRIIKQDNLLLVSDDPAIFASFNSLPATAPIPPIELNNSADGGWNEKVEVPDGRHS